MAQFDPNKKATKWQNAVAGASQNYTDGVSAVTTAPSQMAIAHQQDMLTRFQQAINSGAWAQAMGAVTLQAWQNAAKTIGAPRLADGARKGYPKVLRYLTAAAPKYAALHDQISAMPNGTDQQRIARLLAAVDGMRQFKGLGK